MYAKKNSGKKILVTLLALVLVIGCTIGGTIAWLTDVTAEVKNTFTASGIDITLTETEGVVDSKWQKQMIPGKEYKKNPIVAVDDDATNIDVYLFVKFEEGTQNANYLDYTSTLIETDDGWKKVPNTTDVWYRVVENDAEVQSWNLLLDDKVTVNSSVTAQEAANTDAIEDVYLKYTAYAIQVEGFEDDIASAWAAAQGLEENA